MFKMIRTLWLHMFCPLQYAKEEMYILAVKHANHQSQVELARVLLDFYREEFAKIDPYREWNEFANIRNKIEDQQNLFDRSARRAAVCTEKFERAQRTYTDLLHAAPTPKLYSSVQPPPGDLQDGDVWLQPVEGVARFWDKNFWKKFPDTNPFY